MLLVLNQEFYIKCSLQIIDSMLYAYCIESMCSMLQKTLNIILTKLSCYSFLKKLISGSCFNVGIFPLFVCLITFLHDIHLNGFVFHFLAARERLIRQCLKFLDWSRRYFLFSPLMIFFGSSLIDSPCR